VDDLWGYVIAGYAVTGAAVGLYVWSLFGRARRARARALAVAERAADSGTIGAPPAPAG
jgi:hypothetical protein